VETSRLLNTALITDSLGNPSQQFLLKHSTDWDEVEALTRTLYTPCRLDIDTRSPPSTSMYATEVGNFVIGRLQYGAQIKALVDQSNEGTGLALTLLKGSNNYSSNFSKNVELVSGETFVIDTSSAFLDAEISHDTQSLNLVFSRQHLARLHQVLYGIEATASMWSRSYKLESGPRSLIPLLEYITQCCVNRPEEMKSGILGRHLDEMIAIHLLESWRESSGFDQTSSNQCVHSVKLAEEYMRAHLKDVPTREAIAKAANVSVRALTDSFQKAKGTSPMAYLRQLRLEAVRQELLLVRGARTVTEVAADWGFNHPGNFSCLYFKYFGEKPSSTGSH
jgi:AraC-like DNA-binding protein